MNRLLKTGIILGVTLVASAAFAQNATGKWTGKLDIKAPALPANAPAQQRQMMESQLAQARKLRIAMTVNANKTYTATASGGMLPKPDTTTGVWSQKGDKVTMKTTKRGGVAVAKGDQKEMVLTISKDGKTMFATLPGGQGVTAKIVFTR